MDYTKRLKELRIANGYTQAEIAFLLHTRQEQYSKYENGKRELPVVSERFWQKEPNGIMADHGSISHPEMEIPVIRVDVRSTINRIKELVRQFPMDVFE